MTDKVLKYRHRAGWFILLAAFLWGAGIETASANESPRRAEEYDVKAAFLFNVLKFVDWPNETGKETMVITVVNHPAFAGKVSNLEGKKVRGQRIRVEHMDSLPSTLDSSVVIVSELPEPDLLRLIEIANEKNILILSDRGEFTARGGMIGIPLENRRIQVIINPDAVKSAGLKVNSKLLRIARIVSATGTSRKAGGVEGGN